MKTEAALNKMILEITNEITNKYPELTSYLDEMPMTIPDQKHPDLTIKALTSYYNSLVVVVNDYKENHKKDNINERFEIFSATKPINDDMEKSNYDLYVTVNNLKIYYNDIGEGTVPVIFLHGFPFDKSMWNEQLDALKATHRLIAVDIRGFGKSMDENTPLSMELFTDDLILFMEELNIERAIICGLSMGGFIALDAIKRFPERFDALILCDTQCIADTPEVKQKREDTIKEINTEGSDNFKDKFLKKVFYSETFKNKPNLVQELRSVVNANSDKVIKAGLLALANRSETCSILKNINVPTLIICGKEDEVTPLAQSESMHKTIEKSTLRIIGKAGHVSNLESPAEFNNYLIDFLDSLSNLQTTIPNSEPLSPKL